MSETPHNDPQAFAWLESTSLSHRSPFLWISLAVILVASIPGVLLDYFPYADAVNHVARFRILGEANTDPALGQFYQSVFQLNTNMGFEFLYVTLFQGLDPVVYLKMANGLIVVSFVFGTVFLGYAIHGTWRVFDLISILFVFNYAYIFGFLNFSFGAGLALLCFAGWIVLRKRQWFVAGLFGAVAAFVLYVVHLFALGLFGLSLLCYEGYKAKQAWDQSRQRPTQAAGVMVIAFMPTMVLAIWQLLPKFFGREATHIAAQPFRYGGWEDRGTAVVGPLLTYFDAWDLAIWAALAALIFWLIRTKKLALSSDLSWLVIALSVLVLVMPARLLDAWGPHFRPGIFLAFVLIAGLRIRNWRSDHTRLAIAVVVVLFGMRMTGLIVHNVPVARDFKSLETIVATLPAGSTVIGVFSGERRGPLIVAQDRKLTRFQYNHATTVATLRAGAFTPSVFSRSDVHNIAVHAAYRHLDTSYLHPQLLPIFCDTAFGPPVSGEQRPERGYAYGWAAKFDYVLAIGEGLRPLCPSKPLRQIAGQNVFTLYAVGDPEEETQRQPGD